jgi:hypothetical protein
LRNSGKMNSHSQIEADLSTPYFAAREYQRVPHPGDCRGSRLTVETGTG